MLADALPLIAGLGMFLLGMVLLEDALAALAGLPLRRFLRDRANTPLRGLLVGTAATAVLQSSALVSLLVLAFVGAGILQLTGALGVIMGANLGTTLTSWLVAMLGFKLELAVPGMLCVGVAGVGYSLLPRGGRGREFAALLLGFGLLLYALDLMRHGLEAQVAGFDAALFSNWSFLLLAVAGMVTTAMVQSSTASMMIVLGALHGGIIDLPAAAAFVAGTGVGTTFTAVIGAVGGSADKKRVATAHLAFNLIKAALSLALLHPILQVLGWLPMLEDPLLRLAGFQTGTNLLTIALLMPFSARISAWLGRRFGNGSEHINHYLHAAGDAVPEAGLEAVRKEARRALAMAIAFNRQALHLAAGADSAWPDPEVGPVREPRRGPAWRYRRLKRLEGELVEYAARLHAHQIEPAMVHALASQLEAVRQAVTSAKMVKDIHANLVELRLSMQPLLDVRLEGFSAASAGLYQALDRLDPDQPETALVESLAALRERARGERDRFLAAMYRDAASDAVGEEALSTLLNISRGLYSSSKALLRALALHLLPPDTAGVMEDTFQN